MSDVEKAELYNAGRTVGVTSGGRGARRKEIYRCVLALALLMTVGFVVVSGVGLWNQKKMEMENVMLRQDVEILETKIQTVEEKLSELIPSDARGSYEASMFRSSRRRLFHGRLKRSADHGRTSANHRRRTTVSPTTNTKAVHFRLDTSEVGSTNELKWKIWTETEPFLADALRLSADKKSATINEAGLYLIYAQVHFENAKPRNAFAVKVNDTFIMKCFQSLDYFNQSLTSTENTRIKPCYTSSVVVLRRHQVLTIVNLYPSHRIFNDPYANFWGVVKLADI